jgi:hypothetical protein
MSSVVVGWERTKSGSSVFVGRQFSSSRSRRRSAAVHTPGSRGEVLLTLAPVLGALSVSAALGAELDSQLFSRFIRVLRHL